MKNTETAPAVHPAIRADLGALLEELEADHRRAVDLAYDRGWDEGRTGTLAAVIVWFSSGFIVGALIAAATGFHL